MNKYSYKNSPKDISKGIAKKHRLIRKKKGFSQLELAERSGVSFGSVKRFEQTGKISLESLLKLLFVLGKLHEFETILNPIEDLNHIEKLFSNKTKS